MVEHKKMKLIFTRIPGIQNSRAPIDSLWWIQLQRIWKTQMTTLPWCQVFSSTFPNQPATALWITGVKADFSLSRIYLLPDLWSASQTQAERDSRVKLTGYVFSLAFVAPYYLCIFRASSFQVFQNQFASLYFCTFRASVLETPLRLFI